MSAVVRDLKRVGEAAAVLAALALVRPRADGVVRVQTPVQDGAIRPTQVRTVGARRRTLRRPALPQAPGESVLRPRDGAVQTTLDGEALIHKRTAGTYSDAYFVRVAPLTVSLHVLYVSGKCICTVL